MYTTSNFGGLQSRVCDAVLCGPYTIRNSISVLRNNLTHLTTLYSVTTASVV
jgi:hypothetical protein